MPSLEDRARLADASDAGAARVPRSRKDLRGSLLTVINDILDFSKIEAGRLEVETIPFSLRESLGDTMKTLALEAHRRALSSPMKLRPTPRMRCSATRCGCARCSQPGGQCRQVHRARRSGDVRSTPIERSRRWMFYFTVSDTGVGIDEEKQTAIFARSCRATLRPRAFTGAPGWG